MRGFHTSSRLRRRLMIDGTLIVLLGLTGPFGTFVELSGPLRLVYWAVAIGSCSIFVHVAVAATLATPLLRGWPAPPRAALGAMLAAFPGAATIGLLERVLRGNNALVEDYFWLWFCVAIIGFVVALFQFSIVAPWFERVKAVPEASRAGDRFLERLPRDIGRDLVSLSMQDHYVEATTSRGSALVLIRFGDALNELADVPGAQVHRSHWVARDQARRMLREKNRLMIELADGRRLPVSRPHLQEARKLVALDADRPGGGAVEAAKPV